MIELHAVLVQCVSRDWIKILLFFSATGCSNAPSSRMHMIIQAAWIVQPGRCPGFCPTRITAPRRTSPTPARRVRVMSTRRSGWRTKTTMACTRRYRITSDPRTLFPTWRRRTVRVYSITSTARHCWPARTPTIPTRIPANGRTIWRWSRGCVRAWNDPVTTRRARAWVKTTLVRAHRRTQRRRTRSRPRTRATSPPRTARFLLAGCASRLWHSIVTAYRHAMSTGRRCWTSRFTVRVRMSQCRCKPTDASIEAESRASRSLKGSSCHSTGLFKAARLSLM